MSVITTINSGDLITNSRTTINNNFANLNAGKIETSVIDTDTTLAANSDAKLPSQKAIKAYVDAALVNSISSETTAGATHSLTTLAGQKVIVWVKGNQTNNGSSGTATLTLKYNGVTKDTQTIFRNGNTGGDVLTFSMMYTETPGAATANIVAATDLGLLSNVVIIVLKI